MIQPINDSMNLKKLYIIVTDLEWWHVAVIFEDAIVGNRETANINIVI